MLRPSKGLSALLGQVAASASLFYGLRIRRFIPFVITGIIIAHTALYVTAPGFFPPAATSTASAGQSSSQTQGLGPPAVGEMQTWAQLYPGASVDSHKTHELLDLTSWNVDYTVAATPEQILGFYKDLAKKQGFVSDADLNGFHSFKQQDGQDDFYLGVFEDPKGSRVIYQARSFGHSR